MSNTFFLDLRVFTFDKSRLLQEPVKKVLYRIFCSKSKAKGIKYFN